MQVLKDEKETKKSLVNLNNMPIHVGIIMDGNGRWAIRRGKERLYGHQHAIQSIRDIVEVCIELSIQYLTIYAFSTENKWRPEEEVKGIMSLITGHFARELHNFIKNNIRLKIIGNVNELPIDCQNIIQKVLDETKHHNTLHFTIALNYGGRSEIVNATKAIVSDVQAGVLDPACINDELFENYLYTQGIPDPDLLIRTSGEKRLSGFLPWQSIYSELYFSDVLWPDFRKNHFYDAIMNFQQRKRRFGKLSNVSM